MGLEILKRKRKPVIYTYQHRRILGKLIHTKIIINISLGLGFEAHRLRFDHLDRKSVV